MGLHELRRLADSDLRRERSDHTLHQRRVFRGLYAACGPGNSQINRNRASFSELRRN